jgi:hypothetical protein
MIEVKIKPIKIPVKALNKLADELFKLALLIGVAFCNRHLTIKEDNTKE